MPINRARIDALHHYSVDPEFIVCASCRTRTPPFELDHIDGDGKAHRQSLQEPLERWLKRNGWPPIKLQVLCVPCHREKSVIEGYERRRALKLSDEEIMMPARNGTREVRGNIEKDLAEQFESAVKKSGVTNGEVLERALSAYFAGNVHGFGSVAKQIYDQKAALQTVTEELTSLQQRLIATDAKIERLLREMTLVSAGLLSIQRNHQATQAQMKRRWWYRLIFGRDEPVRQFFPNES